MRITQARPISRHGERGGKRGTTKEIPAYRWQLPDRVKPPITSSQGYADIVTEGYFWHTVGSHLTGGLHGNISFYPVAAATDDHQPFFLKMTLCYNICCDGIPGLVGHCSPVDRGG